jgi:hypothetical protein
MLAHGVIDTPNFHDGNDGAFGRALGYRQVSAHLAVAHGHSDVGVVNHDNNPQKENGDTIKERSVDCQSWALSAASTPQGFDPL